MRLGSRSSVERVYPYTIICPISTCICIYRINYLIDFSFHGHVQEYYCSCSYNRRRPVIFKEVILWRPEVAALAGAWIWLIMIMTYSIREIVTIAKKAEKATGWCPYWGFCSVLSKDSVLILLLSSLWLLKMENLYCRYRLKKKISSGDIVCPFRCCLEFSSKTHCFIYIYRVCAFNIHQRNNVVNLSETSFIRLCIIKFMNDMKSVVVGFLKKTIKCILTLEISL